MRRFALLIALLGAGLGTTARAQTNPTLLPQRHVFIETANKGDILFGPAAVWHDNKLADSWYCLNPEVATTTVPESWVASWCQTHDAAKAYFIKADGGGLNETHVSATPGTTGSDQFGGVVTVTTAVTSVSGDLWFTNTGGRGSDNDIILMVGVKPPIRSDFSIRIQASGWYWDPYFMATPYIGFNPTIYKQGSPTWTMDATAAGTMISGLTHLADALDETYTKADFIYGPQLFRPGPGGTAGGAASVIPMYSGQITSDPTTAEYLFFVDLKAGNIKPSTYNAAILAKTGRDLGVDNGAVKIHYTVTGLDTEMSLNAYGWVASANQGEGISFTNDTRPGAASPSGFLLAYNGADTMAPTCALVRHVLDGEGHRVGLVATVQDGVSGLASGGVVATTATNLTTAIDTFAQGYKGAVTVTANKVAPTEGARLVLTVTDVAGNTTTCAPEIDVPAPSPGASSSGGCTSAGSPSVLGLLGLLALGLSRRRNRTRWSA